MYDEWFCRMWEFYLHGARCAFLYEHHVVWQIQLAKDIYALPNITRDYIVARENELRERESPTADLRFAGNDWSPRSEPRMDSPSLLRSVGNYNPSHTTTVSRSAALVMPV
jgi:hypothetical protein